MSKKLGDKPDLLTKEEMDRLLIAVSDNLYFNTLYNLLLHTGRRIGEIYGTYREKKLTGGIKVKDINFQDKNITTNILKTKKRKLQMICPSCKEKSTYKHKFCNNCGTKMPEIDKSKLFYDITDKKTISIKDNTIALLEKYCKKKKQNSYLFRELSLVYLKKQIKTHCIQAKIEKRFSLHGFRHYFITQCKRAGMSNERIALWTGHAKPESLNIYNRMVPKEVEEEISKIEL